MKLIRDDEGQTLVFTALLLCVLMGFMALAIDVGVIYHTQRRLQTQADAAAIAGAMTAEYSTSSWSAAATTAAQNNGMPAGATLTPHNPPTYGQHTGAEYYEVIITQPSSAIFMNVFAQFFPTGPATNYGTMTVGARAVAGIVPGSSCVEILDPSNPGSLTVKGGATVTTPNCVIKVDSSSPEALCVTGQNANASFNSAGVLLTNAQQTSGNCNKIYGGASTGSSGDTNPFSGVVFPNPANVCTPGVNVVTTASPISAIPSGITAVQTSVGGFSTSTSQLNYNVICFNAGAGIPTTLSNATLGSSSNPNTLFLFENGVVLSGSNTINGTMDLDNGIFCQGSYNTSNGKCSWSSSGGQPKLTMTSPINVLNGTSYAWNGMAFVMPSYNHASYCDNSYGGPAYSPVSPSTMVPNSCLQMQFGSGSGDLTGMIYAPGAAMYMQDNGGGTVVTDLIVDSLYVNSSLTITDNYNYVHPTSPLNHVSLVE